LSDTSEDMKLVADVLAAYLSKNEVAKEDLADVIMTTRKALFSPLEPEAPPEPEPAPPPIPAVPIRRSITPDAIISLETGQPFRALKRHLTSLGMTVDEYKAKWGLPADYPMVAPNYSLARSNMAKSLGLGRKPAVTPSKPAAGAARKTTPSKAVPQG
jgi:predicted transcriptional regulator